MSKKAWIPIAGAVLCLLPFVSPSIALVAGIALALVVNDDEIGAAGSKVAHRLLKLSVVALGAGMNLGTVWRAGVSGAGYTFISITATLALGFWLARRAKLQPDVGLLVAVGTAICGGSAIAAVAGVIKPKRQDITVALTTVFLLNAIALIIFPGIGHMLGFSQRQFGLWAALAIHDTSSVVGAAMHYGKEALSVATTVKLTRALWIVPVALVVGRTRKETTKGAKFPVPLFIVGFVATAAIFTYCTPLAGLRQPMTFGAQRLFASTLFLIGSGFSRKALKEVGMRPLVVGVILWLCVGVVTAVALAQRWVK